MNNISELARRLRNTAKDASDWGARILLANFGHPAQISACLGRMPRRTGWKPALPQHTSSERAPLCYGRASLGPQLSAKRGGAAYGTEVAVPGTNGIRERASNGSRTIGEPVWKWRHRSIRTSAATRAWSFMQTHTRVILSETQREAGSAGRGVKSKDLQFRRGVCGRAGA